MDQNEIGELYKLCEVNSPYEKNIRQIAVSIVTQLQVQSLLTDVPQTLSTPRAIKKSQI